MKDQTGEEIANTYWEGLSDMETYKPVLWRERRRVLETGERKGVKD